MTKLTETKQSSLEKEKERLIQKLRVEMQKHLESAITHGYNDAQEDDDGLGEVCRMEARQNLDNAMRDISQALDTIQKESIAEFKEMLEEKPGEAGWSRAFNERILAQLSEPEKEIKK